MSGPDKLPTEVIIVAIDQTAGSALYGMVDVLSAVGNIWQTPVQAEPPDKLFNVSILSPDGRPFTCTNGIPVVPQLSIFQDPEARILILPEIWLGPNESMQGRYPDLMDWIRHKYSEGTAIYSTCSGTVLLAETGLLDGREATSHWGYLELFRTCYPKVRFNPEPTLLFADPSGQIVTAGGTTSWHDLAIHIIARYCNPGEALRIAKIYLLKWHAEGQIPHATLLSASNHEDSVVRDCENSLEMRFRDDDAIQTVVAYSNVSERTLKRRFKLATGSTLIERLQILRIEEAKRLLEATELHVDDISFEVGYEDASFFRRLFKRLTGLSPSQYRRLFKPIMSSNILQ